MFNVYFYDLVVPLLDHASGDIVMESFVNFVLLKIAGNDNWQETNFKDSFFCATVIKIRIIYILNCCIDKLVIR